MKTRILVVDDERSMREMLSILLEREGYEAVEAKNGQEALQLFETSLFDLVISDINMPGINGIELLSRIKALAPEVPVLMITAFATAEQAVDAIKLGAFHYFTKPFTTMKSGPSCAMPWRSAT
jgi:two-component system response regulator PilR (NtrC family)